LLERLPRSFAALVITIEAKDEGVRLDYVQQVVMHEEMKQSELSGQLSGADSALTGAFYRNTSGDRPCFGCGNVAHIPRYCSSDSPRDPSTCYGCGDVGHILGHCPRKHEWHDAKIAEGEASPQGNYDIDGEYVYVAAFMASVGSVKFSDKRCYPKLIDSGASSHTTKEKTHFEELPQI